MAKIAYFDCPTGIAGNMCLGALLDAGVPLAHLKQLLLQLSLPEAYAFRVEKVLRQSQQATHVEIDLAPHPESHDESHPESHDEHHHEPLESGAGHVSHSGHVAHRHLPDIEALIQAADLPLRVKTWSLEIFRTLAIAEGAVHGIPPETVHFHEVGATDALIDIVGTCIGLDWLDIERVYCSALPKGGGTVRAAHGLLPVPAPAVLQMFSKRQVPIYDNGIAAELVTPTGAAIAVTLAERFGAPPAMTLQQTGLGAGSKDFPLPNLLRLWIGEALEVSSPTETVVLLETQIDDLSPQVVGYLYDELFAVGALDVFTQAIGMKKSRPGILLSVLCWPDRVSICEALLFRETTTLGIRRTVQQRTALARSFETVSTALGTVRVKVAYAGGHVVNVQPEYEDCTQLARQHQVPLQEIQQQVLAAWRQHSRNDQDIP
ncbi:MAG: nickel pincer cofactor biosynthesis protein LarC [Thermosynechococcaceae cyanobacterium MS004]|nr:nickel pincer cofactor biosynthesis protein LarC [Thermosynechococcaceae cyanobacterium MS004]